MKEIIKDPMVLEFLGLKRESSYYEKRFGTIHHYTPTGVLLEMGNGFSFMARQNVSYQKMMSFLWIQHFIIACCNVLSLQKSKLINRLIKTQWTITDAVNYYDRGVERLAHETQQLVFCCVIDKMIMVVKIQLALEN